MKCTRCGFAGHDVLFSGTVCKKCADGAPAQTVSAPLIRGAQPPKPVYSCTRCNRVSSCAPCLFTAASIKAGQPVCKVCAGKATYEEVAEIKAIQKEIKMPKPVLVQCGHNNQQYHTLLQKYADQIGYDYTWENKEKNLFQAGEKYKHASMVAIWNGKQSCGALVKELCDRRNIPYFFFENGMLPQMGTFFIDPKGFCGDSILNGDLDWVTDADMERLYEKRAELQAKYPLRDEGFILAPLQIHNDAQILYHSGYKNMAEFIEDVEAAFPNDRIVARPHPGGGKEHSFKRAECIFEGDFLSWAARASRVVAVTSTCLYEAAVLGVPVTAFGDHPFNSHPPEMDDKIAAGALALCVQREGGDIKPILDRFGYAL